MPYNNFPRTARALDFNDITEWMASFCKTDEGRQLCVQIEPVELRSEAETLLDQTGEMIKLIEAGENIFTVEVAKPDPVLRKIRHGSLPIKDDIKAISSFLNQVEKITALIAGGIEPESGLGEIAREFSPLTDMVEFFQKSFDSTGEVKTSANAEIMQLESLIASLKKRIHEKAEKLSATKEVVDKLQDSYITIRNDRVVLPIKIEFKNIFTGIIHGISASDKTAFIEPQELVKENNEMQEAVSEYEEAIYRIYRNAAQMLVEQEKEILGNYEIMGKLDLVSARARFSLLIEGTRPSFTDDGSISMLDLKHPLMVARKENPRPNLLEMLSGEKTLIVSGPNAGGKTVLLKSVALTAMLPSCGIFPSIGKGSAFPFVRKLFAIAGDEQSLEEGQSTFSAYLIAIKEALEAASEGIWIIADEILNGTDPTQATALAETVLEFLEERDCRTFVSTHLPGLKVLAQDDPKMVNAAMGVGEDGKTTFKLTKGHPGASYPLGIAAKVGLPEEIIKRAKEKLSSTHDRYQAALTDLQEKSDALDTITAEYEKKKQDADSISKELESKLKKTSDELEKFEREKNKRLKREITSARSEIAELMEEARKGDENRKRKISEKLRKRADELVKKTKAPESVPFETLKPGDPVWIIPFDRKAELVKKLDDGKVELLSGGVRMTLQQKDIMGIKGHAYKAAPPAKRIELPDAGGLPYELSLLGQTTEEALEQIIKFLDSHTVAGSETVRIIHGKGILKEKATKYLKTSEYVKSFVSAPPSHGGDGAAIVTLKG